METLTEILKVLGGPIVASALTLGGGWLLLRRMERIRKEEEFFAHIRKTRADALVKVLEALGRFHNLTDRVIQWESDPSPRIQEQLPKVREEQRGHLEKLLDQAAANEFLLGELGEHISDCLTAIGRAHTSAEAGAAAEALHQELKRWLPPLLPLPGAKPRAVGSTSAPVPSLPPGGPLEPESVTEPRHDRAGSQAPRPPTS